MNSPANVSIKILLALIFLSVGIDIAKAQRIHSVPVSNVPSQYLRQHKTRRLPNITHLRTRQPTKYTLDSGDTLSIFIDGVLGPLDSNPPVQLPPAGSDLPPSLGYPVVVREDGQIDLPYINPLTVRGLTIKQTRDLIERSYQDGDEPILMSAKNRIMVSLMRKRTHRVTVIRQDQNRIADLNGRSSATRRSDQSATGNIVNLPAGENDVLGALIRTGGLPGINEKDEIRVQRGIQSQAEVRFGNSEFPRSHTSPRTANSSLAIPAKLTAGQYFDRRQSELRDGDVVYIDSRETESYYTGGLLNNGQFLLPRDMDLDVLEAVAIAGRAASTQRNPAAPTELIVLRRLPGKQQVAIRVDLVEALSNPRERIRVAPGDMLILRYKPTERLLNFGDSVFRTYGIGQLGR